MSLDSFGIISVSRCRYKHQHHVVNHCHNFYHLICVTGGNGTLHIDGEACKPRVNDLFLFLPWVYHEIVSDPDRPLCTVDVKFLPGDADMEKQLQKLPVPVSRIPNELRLILENMVEEAQKKRPYYKSILTANFVAFLFHLLRMNGVSDIAPGEEQAGETHVPIGLTEAADELADRVVRFLHNHYDEKISLGRLSRQFAVNQAHLCRVFAKSYGVSPIQHLNNWRLYKAKELLAYTELSITEIARQVGFRSVHYLSRYFAGKEAISPLQYRQKMRESVYLTVEEKYTIVDAKFVN